jgi:hypothetical protein
MGKSRWIYAPSCISLRVTDGLDNAFDPWVQQSHERVMYDIRSPSGESGESDHDAAKMQGGSVTRACRDLHTRAFSQTGCCHVRSVFATMDILTTVLQSGLGVL